MSKATKWIAMNNTQETDTHNQLTIAHTITDNKRPSLGLAHEEGEQHGGKSLPQKHVLPRDELPIDNVALVWVVEIIIV